MFHWGARALPPPMTYKFAPAVHNTVVAFGAKTRMLLVRTAHTVVSGHWRVLYCYPIRLVLPCPQAVTGPDRFGLNVLSSVFKCT